MCPRFVDERIGGEELQRLRHVSKVAGAVVGNIAPTIRAIVADTGKMREELARGNGCRLLRERRAIFLYRSVQIELPALPKLHDGNRGQGFRNRAETVQGRRSGGNLIFEVGLAE